jgi:shikimate kinase
MKIFLTGMPGCGKTTLGRELAHFLGIPFYDLDALIAAHHLMTIPQIFEQGGETLFRSYEREQLEKFLKENNRFILATGGGTPCFFDNMDLMNRSGNTVFLNPSLETIASRIEKDGFRGRPLFEGLHTSALMAKLETMYQHRKEWYQKAKVILQEDDLVISKIVGALGPA